MAIARSIETRLAEAVWSALAADADLAALCSDRIYLGPMALDPSLIVPPQINVRPVPTGDGIGVSGVSNETYRIEIAYFETALRARTPIAAGATETGPDVMSWIERVLVIGNGTADSDASQQGRLTDPDDATKTLNGGIESFVRLEPIMTGTNAGLVWLLNVNYSVRQTKLRQLP